MVNDPVPNDAVPDEAVPDEAALAERFVRFADEECGDYAPTYDRLARLVARRPELLAIAARTRPGQQHPNTFFAAAHYVLGEAIATVSDEEFVAACSGSADELADLCASRLVQTNEVRRCSFLLPAFVAAARAAPKPLALVEVGASAGLLLRFDRYRYDYGSLGAVGPAASAVLVECEARGDLAPPLGLDEVAVASRVGIDLHPVRPDDADAVRWLRALVWPDHPERRARLDAALAAMAADPVPLVAGDALEVLPEVLAGVPADATPVVFHHATLAHFDPEAAGRFVELVPRLAAERGGDLLWLAGEGGSSAGRSLRLVDFTAGSPHRRHLADTHGHGAWLRWLDRAS